MPALPPGHRDSAEPQGCGLRGPGRRLRANGACGQGTKCGIRRPPSPDRCYSLAAWSATDTWCLRSRKASPPRGRASQRRSAWHSQRVQQTRLWEAFPVGKCPLSLRPRTSEGLASSPRQGPQVAVGKEGPQHSLPRRQGAGPLLPPPQPRRPDPVALSYLVQQELSLSATRGVTQGPLLRASLPVGGGVMSCSAGGPPGSARCSQPCPGRLAGRKVTAWSLVAPVRVWSLMARPSQRPCGLSWWRFTELPQGQGLCRPRGHQRDHGFPSLAHCRALPSALAAAPAHTHTCRQESKDAVPVARGHEG